MPALRTNAAMALAAACVLTGCGNAQDRPAIIPPAAGGEAKVERAAGKSATSAKGLASEDLKSIQGYWIAESLTVGTEYKQLRFSDNNSLHIDGDEYVYMHGLGVIGGCKIVLDSTRDPKTIKLTHVEGFARGHVQPGIYRLDADGMRLCLGLPGGISPTAFNVPAGGDHFLFHYRRPSKTEVAALAGNSPPGGWMAEGLPRAGCEVRFPLLPAIDRSKSIETVMQLHLRGNSHTFTCTRLLDSAATDAERLKRAEARLTGDLGTVVRREEFKTPGGHSGLDITIARNGRPAYSRFRVVVANGHLLKLGVGSSQAFVESPDAVQFLKSLEIRQVEVKEIIRDLQDSDERVYNAAADSLGRMGGKAIPELVKAVAHEDSAVRANAAKALGNMGPTVPEALPPLLHVLKDKEWWVRMAAAESLGKFGAAAKDALPSLADLDSKSFSQDTTYQFKIRQAIDKIKGK